MTCTHLSVQSDQGHCRDRGKSYAHGRNVICSTSAAVSSFEVVERWRVPPMNDASALSTCAALAITKLADRCDRFRLVFEKLEQSSTE